MDFGRLEYYASANGRGSGLKRIRLTLVGQDDEEVLRKEGISGLRRKRIVRLTEEARSQGVMLGYEDLADLLLVSMATLKRDVNFIERTGLTVQIKGRRKNGVAASAAAK